MKNLLISNISIKYKFAIAICLILTIAMLSLSFIFIKQSQTILKDALQDKVNLLNKNFSVVSSKSIQENSYSSLQELINEIAATEKHLNFLVIANKNAIVVATSDQENYKQFSRINNPNIISQLEKEEDIIFIHNDKKLLESIKFFFLTSEENRTEALGFIYIGLETTHLEKSIKNLWFYSTILTIIILGFGIIGAFFIGIRMTKPITGLAEEVRIIASGNLDKSIKVKSKDEIGSLISDVEKMRVSIKDLTYNLETKVNERTIQLKEANKKLDEANKARSAFLANMSHEIRTPMNGVIAAADLALSEDLPPKLDHYLTIIHSSAYSLLGIINDILDFSKIDAGKLDLEKRPFILYDILDALANMFGTKTMDKNIELVIDIEAEVPTALYGDPLRLQQILTNLIGNAIKFTDKEGTVILSVKPVEISSKMATLKFCVKDTGIGMTPKQRSKLFQPFIQADSSTTRKYGGTGLGLSISKQLVQLMGGEIWVKSKINKGSKFYFTVKLERQSKEKEQIFSLSDEIKKLQVLIIDDCLQTGLIIQKILKSFQLKSDWLPSGKEALTKLQQHNSFNLILIDWRMPEIDGIEIIKIIRKDLKLDIPIILMSAFSSELDKFKTNEMHIDGVLSKPINPSSLFNAIIDLFAKKTVIEREEKTVVTKESIYKNRLQGIKVLVAEDNLTNQDIAQAIFDKAKIPITIVNNGEEAVFAVQKQNFDVVLMDIQMPVMDGYAATKKIRDNPKFSSLPIVAMTANAMKGDEEKCINIGMNGYVSKPIKQDILFHTIWRVLEK
ncbi:MAG: response regulator [Desulfobacterales bacterium]|nr:response regulator [Desulfobacterales bacterium]